MTTDTKTKTEAPAQELKQSAPLAKPAPVIALGAALPADYWSRDRVELIKKSIVPQGCTDLEFEFFLEQCKRTELDPLKKEAYLLERKMKINRGTKDEKWVSRFEFQPSEAGLAARTDRFPDFGGINWAAV